MTYAEQIVAWAKERVGCPYIYGCTGSNCTPSERKARINQYPSQEANITKMCPVLSGKATNCTGCKFKGLKGYDCAQLTRRAAESVGMTLPSGANSQARKVSWQLFGTIKDMPRDKVCFLYHLNDSSVYNHTGIYLGNGRVIDARGSAYGVMESALESYGWTHFGRLPGMDKVIPGTDPAQTEEDDDMPTLRKGDKGASVVAAQTYLMVLGYALPKYGADGKFGSETEKAVKVFQEAVGLYADGVIGKLTWAALMEMMENVNQDCELGEPETYTVVIPGVDGDTMNALLTNFAGAYVQGV